MNIWGAIVSDLRIMLQTKVLNLFDLYNVVKGCHKLKISNEDFFEQIVEYFVMKGFDSEELSNMGLGRGTKFLYYLIQ